MPCSAIDTNPAWHAGNYWTPGPSTLPGMVGNTEFHGANYYLSWFILGWIELMSNVLAEALGQAE